MISVEFAASLRRHVDCPPQTVAPGSLHAVRIAVDGKMCVTCTDDGGASFQRFSAGLPQQHAYHLVYRRALDVGADGVALAMASTTGSLWISRDAGESWHAVSQDLPPVAAVRFVG